MEEEQHEEGGDITVLAEAFTAAGLQAPVHKDGCPLGEGEWGGSYGMDERYRERGSYHEWPFLAAAGSRE